MHLIEHTRRFAAALAGLTTGPILQRGATVKAGRRRSFPARLAAAALAIPALTVASGSVMAATAARAARTRSTRTVRCRPGCDGRRQRRGHREPNGPGLGAQHHRAARQRHHHQRQHPGQGAPTGRHQGYAGQGRCDHTLALTPMGHVLAWGSDSDGQLGDGRISDSVTPVRVIPRRTKITAIRAGCEHSLALTSKGQVLAWGYNHGGELGNGSTANSDVPVWVRLPGTLRSRPSALGSISAWPAPPTVRCWPGETTTAGSLATAAPPAAIPSPGRAARGRQGNGRQRRGGDGPGPHIGRRRAVRLGR